MLAALDDEGSFASIPVDGGHRSAELIAEVLDGTRIAH